MATIVSTQHPGRPRADIHVMTKGFLGRPEPLCDASGEPINFSPNLFRCRDRVAAETAIRDARREADAAAKAASVLECDL